MCVDLGDSGGQRRMSKIPIPRLYIIRKRVENRRSLFLAKGQKRERCGSTNEKILRFQGKRKLRLERPLVRLRRVAFKFG